MSFDFGRCPCGGGEYRQQEVEVNLHARSLKLEGIIQGVCSSCGGRVYKLDTLWRIEALMRDETVDPVANQGHRSQD